MAENEQIRTVEGKRAMIEALEKTLGIVTTALKQTGIGRSTYYGWLQDDPEFKADVEAISDIALDFVESQLHKQIQEGQPSSTIFYMKTKGKKRGYIERQELTGADGGPINHDITLKL
jgi:hypothetical protein